MTSLYFLGLFSKRALSAQSLPDFSLKIFSNSASAFSALANGVFWNWPAWWPILPQLVNRIQMSLCFSFQIWEPIRWKKFQLDILHSILILLNL